MLSNQVLQNTLDGLKSITAADFSVLDMDGKTLAATFDDGGACGKLAKDFYDSASDSEQVQGYQFFKVYDDKMLEYVLAISGQTDQTYMIGKMAAFQIQSLLVASRERLDKDNFIKNLLLDNLLLVDIYSRAKKLRIVVDTPRVAIVVETDNIKDANVLEMIRSFSGTGKDFVTAVDESNVILIKDLAEEESTENVGRVAEALKEHLGKEGLKNIHVAYGTTVNGLKEVSRSYKEAKMALDIGKIFFDERSIVAYTELGIGRLIYQLPMPLCKLFIKEIFDGISPDEFDEETLTTINKFFENSLNVSETSRKLFIHRNTLVYRLDKLQKITGLDLRVFEDAITFKIALMVVKYMKHMESFEY